MEISRSCYILTMAASSLLGSAPLWKTVQQQNARLLVLEASLLDRTRYSTTTNTDARNLEECQCPFKRTSDGKDYETVDSTSLFIFGKGILIGTKNVGNAGEPACTYGKNVLSVDLLGTNCPSGDGAVTFGSRNKVSGTYSVVTGGAYNTAAGIGSAVSGGFSNAVSNLGSSIAGGYKNTASEKNSVVSGGESNTASGNVSSVSGGRFNSASAYASSISGGVGNRATAGDTLTAGAYGSISGGSQNEVKANRGSISGGEMNKVYYGGSNGSISGGRQNEVKSDYGSISGGYKNKVNDEADYGSILGGKEHLIDESVGNFLMIPEEITESRITTLEGNSPFICSESICAGNKRFKFNKKVTMKKAFCPKKTTCE